MINENRSTTTRPKSRFIKRDEPKHSVWAEQNKRGGYTIYAGIKGTDIKTYAGTAMSRTTLDYNLRKARSRFNLSVV